MNLLDRLDDDDDAARLAAVRSAAQQGDLQHVAKLLDIALYDQAEVRTMGGIAEVYEHVGDAAANSLAVLWQRKGYDEARIQAVAFDLRYDDERVASLLYYLGPLAEPLRQEMERHAEERLRYRALKAVLSIHRSADFSERLLADPSPRIRLEALAGTLSREVRLRLLHQDPAPEVRLAAARALRFAQTDSDPIIAASRTERDAKVRAMLLSCLTYLWRDGRQVAYAMLPFLAEPEARTRREAAEALRNWDLPAVGAAIGAQCLVETDEAVLCALLQYRSLMAHAPELKEHIARFARTTTVPGYHHMAMHAIQPLLTDTTPYRSPLPLRLAALNAEQQARLKRLCIEQAVLAVEARLALRDIDRGEAAALAAVKTWLAHLDYGSSTALLYAQIEAENAQAMSDPYLPKVDAAWDAVRAALAEPTAAVTRAARVVAAALRDDPAFAAMDGERAPIIAYRRGLELATDWQGFAAAMLEFGVEPPRPQLLSNVIRAGEDLLEAWRAAVSVEECRQLDNLSWLRLAFRPEQKRRYMTELGRVAIELAQAELPDASEDGGERACIAAAERCLSAEEPPPALEIAAPSYAYRELARARLPIQFEHVVDHLARRRVEAVVARWQLALAAALLAWQPELPELRFSAPWPGSNPAADALPEAIARITPSLRWCLLSVSIDRAAQWLEQALRRRATAFDPARAARHRLLRSLRRWSLSPTAERWEATATAHAELEAIVAREHHLVGNAIEALLRASRLVPTEAAALDDACTQLQAAFHFIAAEHVKGWLMDLATAMATDGEMPSENVWGESAGGAAVEGWLASAASQTQQDAVLVHVGERTMALPYRQSVQLLAQEVPDGAVVSLRCSRCGAITPAQGPVEFSYVDDDHYGYTDLGYEARPTAACTGCGAFLLVDLRFTVTRHRSESAPEIIWDAADRTVGGTLLMAGPVAKEVETVLPAGVTCAGQRWMHAERLQSSGDLSAALAMYEDIEALVPVDAEALPLTAFRSPEGLALRATHPTMFEWEAIHATIVSIRWRIACMGKH